MSDAYWLLSTAVTFVLSLSLPVLVRPMLVKFGIMDVPNERSSHDRPVLRGLGLAVLIAMLCGGVFASFLVRDAGSAYFWQLLIVVLGGAAAGVLGFAEDLWGLAVPVRSVCLLAIATGSVIAVLAVFREGAASLSPSILGALTAPLQLTTVSATLVGIYGVLFISGFINVANFMDGLNGMSGFHGVLAGGTFTVIGALCNLPWLIGAGGVLAAGFAGFLPWNLSRRGAFLGDVGSYLLGGAIALTSFAAFIAGVPVLATIGPMVIYFGDVGVTLLRRVRAGYRWSEPHKEHTYQRLQQAGLSHISASATTVFFSALTAGLGVASLWVSSFGAVFLFVAGLAVLIVYLRLPEMIVRAQRR